jgi:hypothetical protein
MMILDLNQTIPLSLSKCWKKVEGLRTISWIFVQMDFSSSIVVSDRRGIVEKWPVEVNKKKILNDDPA